MTDVHFYHLQNRSIESVLPTLLERSLERGWRAVVQASEDRIEALDAHLWTYRDDSFLPHGTDRDAAAAADQPVLLTAGDRNPNQAAIRFLIDRAPLPDDAGSYQRIVLLFDGDDPDAVAQARAHWTAAREQGHEVTYWQSDDQGRWQRKT